MQGTPPADSEVVVTLRVDLEEVPGQGWVAEVLGANAVAQGDTSAEAIANLAALLDRYSEVIREAMARSGGLRPRIELIPA